MENYPAAVAQIAGDYLERAKAHLKQVPLREREEFLREIESHIYEAYQREPGEDAVPRILAVLRKLGEPQDLVADRLPESIVRSGTRRKLPVQVLAGIVIALFGIPLGVGGVGAVVGVLGAMLGLLAAYYAATVAMLLSGTLFLALGLLRIYQPVLWDRLVANGIIQMDEQGAELVERILPGAEGFLLLAAAALLIGLALGMLWLGRYLVRGLRLLFAMVFDGARRAAEGFRKWANAPRTAERYAPARMGMRSSTSAS